MADKKKEKILFVDDEESILDVAGEYFRQKGYRVLTAKNGFEALKILEREKIDCCFTDINMPEMDGIVLAEHIRMADNTVPVVVMTGFPSLDNVMKTIKNGVVDFLIKPLNLSQMEVCIQRVMRERRLFIENMLLKKEVEGKERLEKLSRELHSKVEELHILNKIMNEFTGIGESSDAFMRLVNMTIEVTPADEANFFIVNDTIKNPFEIARSRRNGFQFQEVLGKETEKLIMDVAADEMPLLISENRHLRLPSEIQSFIAAPLAIRGKIFGVLTGTVHSGGSIFSEKMMYYLMFMVNKAAYAIENLALYENIYENLFTAFLALVKALEAKDPDTGQHSKRVTEIALAMAKEIGCSSEELDILNIAGRLHDIGKIGIKDEILQKPGALTDDEFEKIKEHSVIGANIVGQLGLWDKEKQIIRHHHERFDGSGYPDGLKKEEIPFLSRILSLADAYDAMSHDRIYRERLEEKKIVRIIEEEAGNHFDPEVVKVFQKLYAGNCFCC
jgi:putative nucleotidyltransferase with HDIG domain